MAKLDSGMIDNSCEIILAEDIRIESVAQMTLEVPLQSAMEEQWHKALQNNPELFNGEILLLQSWERDTENIIRLSTAWGTYQMLLASRTIVSMRDIVHPLGVSGIIVCGTGEEDSTPSQASALVFARRSETVTTYPNYWELIPSGSISRDTTQTDYSKKIDYLRQIFEEFEQETGFSTDIIKKAVPFALVFDKHANIYDICIRLNLSIPQTILAKQFRENNEYTELTFVAFSQVPLFLQNHLLDIVPTSRVLAETFIRVAHEEQYEKNV